MAKLTIEEILAAIDELTVIELNDLVKACLLYTSRCV